MDNNEFFEHEIHICRDAIFQWLRSLHLGGQDIAENRLKEVCGRYPKVFRIALEESEVEKFEWMGD